MFLIKLKWPKSKNIYHYIHTHVIFIIPRDDVLGIIYADVIMRGGQFAKGVVEKHQPSLPSFLWRI